MPEVITKLEILITSEGGESYHLSVPVDASIMDKFPKNADGHYLFQGEARLWLVGYPNWKSEEEREEWYRKRNEEKNNSQNQQQ